LGTESFVSEVSLKILLLRLWSKWHDFPLNNYAWLIIYERKKRR
jgi:hypothetical protein